VKHLVTQFAIEPETVRRLDILLDALAEDRAPTTVHDRAEASNVHLADALTALEIPAVARAARIADLGAGAGVPGLVLAAALPSAHVTLVESVAKKCAFISDAAAAMGLGNVDVVCARAEEWAAGRGSCDVVTARAVASLPVLCEYAAPLLRAGGALVAWKGDVSEQEDRDGRAAAEQLGLGEPDVHAVDPYRGSRDRHLHVFCKIAPTPAGFPRRPGIAAKRPLSASTRS
jgi:16S rRNA (guanine527-N7)-methyltransferase